MNRMYWMITAMMAGLASQAAAFGFEGAQISAETLAYSDENDFGSTTYSGGLEFGVGGGIGVGADLSYYGFDALGLDAQNLTLHGLYNINPITDVGLFVSQDSYDGLDTQSYGIEGLASFGGTTVEGYLGKLDGDLAEGSMIGVNGSISLFGGFSANIGFDQASLDSKVNRMSIGGEYQLGMGPVLYAEYGKVDDGDLDETYLSFGARLTIGPNQGTTFSSRSVFEIVPGF
jgi:hypothetical protein